MDRPRVLAVDDEPRSLELLVRCLRQEADVQTASSGDEAWELFQAGSYDLVLTDQRMPGMKGSELLTRVAESADHVGRIILTGYSDLEGSIQAINGGRVHAYLHKPYSPQDLLMAVKGVYQRVQLGRENLRLLTMVTEQNHILTDTLSLARDRSDALQRLAAELLSEAEERGARGLLELSKQLADESERMRQGLEKHIDTLSADALSGEDALSEE